MSSPETGSSGPAIQPDLRPREGWGEAFKAMAEQGEDQLLDEEVIGTTSWDQEEWEW